MAWVPTVAEAGKDYGLAGFDINTWFGVLAPAKTPAPVVGKLNAEIRRALQSAALKERLLAQGAIPGGQTPAEFATFIAAETAKWAQVVKASGAKVD